MKTHTVPIRKWGYSVPIPSSAPSWMNDEVLSWMRYYMEKGGLVRAGVLPHPESWKNHVIEEEDFDQRRIAVSVMTIRVWEANEDTRRMWPHWPWSAVRTQTPIVEPDWSSAQDV